MAASAICPGPFRFPGNTPHAVQIERGQTPIQGIVLSTKKSISAVIARVEPDSPAERAGLRAGQCITEINGITLGTVKDLPPTKDAELLLVDLGKHFWHLGGDQSFLLGRLEECGSHLDWLGPGISIRVAGDPTPKTWTLSGPAPGSQPTHPTQLYSFVESLLLCIFLLAYYPFRTRDGEVWPTMTIHPISRFLIEIIRSYEQPVFDTPWSISQNISLLILACAACLWIFIYRPARIVWPLATAPPYRPVPSPTPAGAVR